MRKINKKVLVIAAILIIAGTVSAGAYYGLRDDNSKVNTPTPSQAEQDESAAQNAKQAEKDDVNRIKESTPPATDANPQASSDQKNVTPQITSASQIESQVVVSGFVPGIIEENGTCTVVAVSGADRITKSKPATANASTTDCANVQVARSEFPKAGTWKVTLAYESATAKGQSSEREVVIR